MTADAHKRLAFLGRRPDTCTGNRVTPLVASGLCHKHRVDDMLERQRSSYGAPAWDWKQTCGLQHQKVWNALELALLADFPKKIQVCNFYRSVSQVHGISHTCSPLELYASFLQAVLRGLISDVFTTNSGVGVMPIIAILAAKYPKTAALLIPDAPMIPLECFYLPDLTEHDLDPVIAATHSEVMPRDIKAGSRP